MLRNETRKEISMTSRAYRTKSRPSPASLHSLVFGLALLLGAETAGAQIRTVLVSPVPGNQLASGTALRNALTGIPSPSSTDRWLLKIEPGIYDVGTTQLQMRSWVDIEGSGIGMTTIRGSVLPENATIHGANNTELRLLTIEAIPNIDGATAMRNDSASPRIYRVKFSTTGGTWGVRNFSSTPLFEECEITVTGLSPGSAYGVSFRGILPGGSRSSILRTKITVSGAGHNHGVSTRDGLFITEIRDSLIHATGGSTARGVHGLFQLLWSGQELLQIRNTEIQSWGGSSASYGIDLDAGTWVNLEITGSKIWGHLSPTTYGIRQAAGAAMGMQGASIVGMTGTIETAGSAAIASTMLNGGPVTAGGWLGCMGVWDENGVFYAQGCP
jgi:hypothetical protein